MRTGLRSYRVGKYYSTNFTGTENPISEGGLWLNANTDGGSSLVSNMQKSGGLAYGTQVVGSSHPPYDSIACLRGTWGNNQWIRARVRITNPRDNTSTYQEVRTGGRGVIQTGLYRGYSHNTRCVTTFDRYTQMTRWVDISPSVETEFAGAGAHPSENRVDTELQDLDYIMFSIIGDDLKMYINGVLKNSATDTTYPTGGGPMIGHWQNGALGNINDYGFDFFECADFPLF